MPHYFRGEEAAGLNFTCQFEFTGQGGGDWTMRVADERVQVHPGCIENPDLTVRCKGELFLDIHRGEANPVLAILTGRLKLRGNRKLFLTFPRILAQTPGHTVFHRWAWKAKRWWKGSVVSGLLSAINTWPHSRVNGHVDGPSPVRPSTARRAHGSVRTLRQAQDRRVRGLSRGPLALRKARQATKPPLLRRMSR